MGSHGATYTDHRHHQLDIEIYEDASAWIAARFDENQMPIGVVIPAEQREPLARALAGWHSGVQAAQPDRPEPIDPASVPRAKAEALREAADSVDAVDGPGSIDQVPSWLRERADALDPASAAVEALANALVGVGVTSAGPDALGYARALIRHRNVRVVDTDA